MKPPAWLNDPTVPKAERDMAKKAVRDIIRRIDIQLEDIADLRRRGLLKRTKK